ncbi:MAG: NACHT domain-containing protein [Pseudonocardiaceae bacterium]
MAGGRPTQGKQQRYPELEELASWFHRALTDAGYRTVHEFLGRGLFEKNAVYGVFGAARLLTLESTQSLAVALKRTSAQVVPIWTRAKEARDRATLATERAQQPRVSSWATIPMPSLALRNLLEAQCAAVERLPYELLAVQEPPLSSVYVRQQVRVRVATDRTERDDTAVGRSATDGRPTAGESSASTGPRLVISVPDALEQHHHLLVTGEPGAGKSTMSSYLARRLSRLWLREDSALDAPTTEPLVPLRVSARSLDSSGSWSAVLHAAACHSLGRSLLADPDPGLFAGLVQGVRWLVLVDGLDEIPDPRVRGDVIRSVAQYARPDSTYRFVVTTRALPESELAPLRTAIVGSYVIEPFDRPALEEFATRWFTVQEVPSPAAETERFLRETSDGRLRELVRNPLLATIAAVSAVKEPGRSLPASRISLYERFCSYLAGDRRGKRNPLAQLRRHHEDNPELLACVRWLHQSRSEILRALARRRMESQDTLWHAAVEWVCDRKPDDVTLVGGWEEHLWEELAGTGLLVAQEDELRFLHQSFAEFLAAQSHAEAIGNDVGELDTWIRRGLREAERAFALFTFALWAARPEHDIGSVVERLLSALDPRRLLFAGRLMAEGVSIPENIAVRVIDRIFAFVRNVDDSELADEGFEVLGALFDYPAVAASLDALAGDTKVQLFRRVSALDAFERLLGGARAQLLLSQLLPSVYGQPLHQCARIAVRLGQAAIDMTERRALQMVEEPDSSTKTRASAAEVMRILSLVTNVAELARSVLAETRATPGQLERAAEAWLAAQGDTAVPEIAALARDRPVHDPAGRARLAAFLNKAGDGKTAESLAGAVLDDEMVDDNAVVTAAETLLAARGAEAVPRVLLAVDRWSERGNYDDVWCVSRMLKQLAPYPDAAVVSRVSVLLEQCATVIGAHALIDAWLAVEPAGESILDTIDRGAMLYIYDQAWSAQHLQAAGAQAAATELAEHALRPRNSKYRDHYKRAASVLLKADRAAAVTQLVRWAAQNPEPAWLAGVMDAFDDTDPEVEQAEAFYAQELVAHPRVNGEELHDALGVLLCYEGESAAHSVAEAAQARHELNFDQRRQLACRLAAVGQLELARSVWAHLLTWQGYSDWQDVGLIDDILNAGVEQWAADRIRDLIDDPATAPLRVQRLRQMLAWLTAACSEPTQIDGAAD